MVFHTVGGNQSGVELTAAARRRVVRDQGDHAVDAKVSVIVGLICDEVLMQLHVSLLTIGAGKRHRMLIRSQNLEPPVRQHGGEVPECGEFRAGRIVELLPRLTTFVPPV